MPLSALVIGYGSIGKRHVEILDEMDAISRVSVLSSQTGLSYETITSLEEIPDLNPDYVVVASPTAQHYSQLEFLKENMGSKKILVEKPLFESINDFHIKYNQVYVGYNLRFHPLLQKIRETIDGRQLWNFQVFCGSYLPDWRLGRDYRKTSSAKKEAGGGVLLDLSHELDYVQWLAGPIEVEHVASEKMSGLEIETDDLLLLSGRLGGGARVHISLNYFTRQSIRQIVIDGDEISIRADLMDNTASVYEDDSLLEFAWPELDCKDTYLAQHAAILNDDFSQVCTYEEGLETMRLIDSIKSFNI